MGACTQKLRDAEERGEARPYNPQDHYKGGDVVVHPRFGEGVVASDSLDGKVAIVFDSGSKTLVCADYRNTQEEVLVIAKPGSRDVPLYHGKGLLETPMIEGTECIGEATGILLFEPGDHDALRRITDWVMHYSTAKTRSEHEDITQRMMLAGKMVAAPFDRSLAFMECDTPEEYAVVRSEMGPRWIGKLV